ncbi:hypothetical protein PAXINDRAFT_10037 [Paxillus involutus ATCC 200175]|nr:hypothetical protein PAXINDRAFT_10037 [Paxillus involutus ATCC 200175]
MSRRLASFKGPSTPTSSPISQPNQPVIPASPSRVSESTFHRKLRTLLQELRAISQTWDDIVLLDGLKAARTLVDTRTELDNMLSLLPPDSQPRTEIVGPKLAIMDKSIARLDTVAAKLTWDDIVLLDGLKAARTLVDTRTELDNMLSLLPPDSQPRTEIVGPKLAIMDKSIAQLDTVAAKLQKQLRRMSAVVDNLEALYHEAQKTKGARWCQEEALWVSWPLEKFVTSLANITTPYHRSLSLITDIIDRLRSHSITFEASKDVISQWIEQPYLEEDGWDAKWEDLCAVEIERWDAK